MRREQRVSASRGGDLMWVAVRWLPIALFALLMVSCEGTRSPGAPGDGSVTPPDRCARPAPGCECSAGEGPINCYPNTATDGVCQIGEMFCRGGAWSSCESVREVAADNEVGAAVSALITEPTACSSCNPTCAEANDTPTDGDLSNDNSDNVIISTDEGGVTLPTRRPPTVPACTEAGLGLPPGGSYEDFCAGSGSLFFEFEKLPSGETEAICSQKLAADTFTHALCQCASMTDSYSLVTTSFNSNGNASDGISADVGTNGLYSHQGRARIGGETTGYGTGTHAPGSNTEMLKGLFLNGPFNTARAFDIGMSSGDAFIRGDVKHSNFTVNSGAGSLFVPTGAAVSGAPANYTLVNDDSFSIEKPCRCDASEIIDITSYVGFTKDRNDNDVIGLDPDTFVSGAGGTVTLPCGRFYLTNVNASNNFTVTATGRTALFIDGDLRTKNLDFALDGPDAEIDVFIAGTMQVDAAIDLGDPARPAKARIYVGGSDPIVLSGNGDFGGNFYAPNATLEIGGSINVYGSLVVDNLDGTSGVTIVYDEAVQETDDCQPTQGSYWRDYDAVTYCGADTEIRPDWGDFTWDADIPTDQSIRFEIQTATTENGLDAASPVTITAPPNGSPINIGDMLTAAGVDNNQPYLRIKAVLISNGVNAPLLRSMNLQFDCGGGTTGVTDPSAFSCGGNPTACNLNCPPEVCDDGIDNDCDGLIDCADSDSCGSFAACCTGEICGDGINNDCDGLEDFYDPECECSVEICDDGLDNDADGDIDCADAYCGAGTACNAWGSSCDAMGACVCPNGTTESDCGDGIDNDCDGKVDCNDRECAGVGGCISAEVCGDGLDNDGDFLTDCDDTVDCPSGSLCGTNGEQCNGSLLCECPGTTETSCTDGIDEDCDGDIDCDDSECAADAACACQVLEDVADCSDGQDNDCDGLTDCNDPDCGCTPEDCSTPGDEDGDGDADCADSDCPAGIICGGNGYQCTAGLCQCPTLQVTELNCADGYDDDCDGVVDCADTDCAASAACLVCPGTVACDSSGCLCADDGCTCDYACDPGDACLIDCEPNSSCVASARFTANKDFKATCQDGADCSFKVDSGKSHTFTCQDNSTCATDCANANCEVVCEGSGASQATCTLDCNGLTARQCSITTCSTAVQSCAGGLLVCNATGTCP